MQMDLQSPEHNSVGAVLFVIIFQILLCIFIRFDFWSKVNGLTWSNINWGSNTWQLADSDPVWLHCSIIQYQHEKWIYLDYYIVYTMVVSIHYLTDYWRRIYSFILSPGCILLFHELHGLEFGYIWHILDHIERLLPHVWGLPPYSTCSQGEPVILEIFSKRGKKGKKGEKGESQNIHMPTIFYFSHLN